jgi:hypothetical protein
LLLVENDQSICQGRPGPGIKNPFEYENDRERVAVSSAGANHKPEFYEGNPALTRLHPLATPEITRKHGRPVEAELTTAAASNARQQAPKL